jgi:hypothetical protein
MQQLAPIFLYTMRNNSNEPIMHVLSQQASQTRAISQKQFAEAKPFRHVVIENFFDPVFCQQILSDFPSFEERFALNEMGQVGGKAVRMGVRDLSDAYRQLDAYIQSDAFLHYMSEITGIPNLLYDPDYVGGGTHENLDGQSLDAHVDFNYHPRTKTHRRLNLIIYLNKEWDDAWGGNLELHSNPWNASENRTQRILPLYNRAVIFETNEISWHGFEAISLPQEMKAVSRKSFAIYLYTKERPAVETASPHATIYVPEGMPRGWEVGKILNDEDIKTLNVRFARLRGQLHYQYDREKLDRSQLANAEQAMEHAQLAWRIPVQGYVKQPEPATGIWEDQWVGNDFVATFIALRATKGLQLEIRAPSQLAETQILSITLDGETWEHQIPPGKKSSIQMKIKRGAGSKITLKIQAAAAFNPEKAGVSADRRELAWFLSDLSFVH